MDLYMNLYQKQQFELRNIFDGFVSYKQAAFASQDVN